MDDVTRAAKAAGQINPPEVPPPIRLDVGCGVEHLDGWIPIDHQHGTEAFPLDFDDGSVDEIRASHILEHFSFTQTADVLLDWCRVLKPGGLLRVAVPDFDVIAAAYTGDNPDGIPVEQVILGAHHDKDDYHKAIFNRDKLTELLRGAGFGDIQEWSTTAGGGASMVVSLNLQGTKGAPNPKVEQTMPLSVGAVMSVPRLGFQDTFFSVYAALAPFNIPVHRFTGAFWGQCMERSMDLLLEKHDVLLTVDYDSVFSHADVQTLIQLMIDHPEADAICSMQLSRGGSWPLFTKYGENGKPTAVIDMKEFDPDLAQIATGHFGLTMIRTAKLRQMPHPWFIGEPNVHGKWEEGRLDDDIYFWKKWEKMGFSLYHANRVPIGHADLFIQWPGFGPNLEALDRVIEILPDVFNEDGSPKDGVSKDTQAEMADLLQSARVGVFQINYQRPKDYWEGGKPPGTWQ